MDVLAHEFGLMLGAVSLLLVKSSRMMPNLPALGRISFDSTTRQEPVNVRSCSHCQRAV
jgi:hypothetical protein